MHIEGVSMSLFLVTDCLVEVLVATFGLVYFLPPHSSYYFFEDRAYAVPLPLTPISTSIVVSFWQALSKVLGCAQLQRS